MSRWPLRAIALAAGIWAAAAGAVDATSYVENDTRKGLVKHPIEPRLPRSIRHLNGYVDIEGAISGAGKIVDPRLTPDREESAPFIEPLGRVLPGWRFSAYQGPDCAPSKEPVRLRVYFENGDMRVTHQPVDQPISNDDRSMRVLHKQPPEFPPGAIRKGIGANVFARAEVAADGSVTSVRVRAFSRQTQDDAVMLSFEVEATRAARKWRFTAAPEGLTRPRIACLTFVFNLDD